MEPAGKFIYAGKDGSGKGVSISSEGKYANKNTGTKIIILLITPNLKPSQKTGIVTDNFQQSAGGSLWLVSAIFPCFYCFG